MSNIELQKEIAVLQTTIQGMSEQLDKVVREAKEEMRERCAKVCEKMDGVHDSLYAEAIRRIEP